MSKEIEKQYHRWPYPDIPLVASIPREQLWQINVEWMLKKAGLPLPKEKTKIWIAGCGTFQPYTFSQANPKASILATDISENSLKISKNRCLLHFQRNVEFKKVDLENAATYPNDKFDFIECYGVLMNLKDPALALKQMKCRLKPNGMLRIMVYPYYGRQPIFKLQRLAKLLGFSADKKEDPSRFRKLIKSLPTAHPLRVAFENYQDSKNDSGIVDAFLHTGDKSFTGTEICKIIEEAGMTIAYTMHRPWGNPKQVKGKDAASALNYLDYSGNLKSNFILNLVDTDAVFQKSDEFYHPLFSLKNNPRVLKHSFLGTKLQTRTYDGAKDISGAGIRRLVFGKEGRTEFEREILNPRVEPRLEPLLSEESRCFKPELPQVFDGEKLTKEQQREVYKFIDDHGVDRRDFNKVELSELHNLLTPFE